MTWPFRGRVVCRKCGNEGAVVFLRRDGLLDHGYCPCPAGRALVPPVPAQIPDPAPVPEPAYEAEFRTWLDAQGFPEAQASHYKGLFSIFLGKRTAPGHSRGSAKAALESAGAPLPL